MALWVALVTWTLKLAAPNGGGDIGELTDTGPFRLIRRLDGHDELQGVTVDGRSPVASLLVDFGTDLVAYRDGVALHRGRVTAPDDDVDGTVHTVGLSSSCYRWMLGRRTLQAALAFDPAVDVEGIGWAVIVHVQTQPGGNLGITRDGTVLGTARVRNFEAGEVAGRLLDDLARATDAHDWDVGPDLVYRTWPARGQVSPLPLVYGVTVEAFSRSVDPARFATSVQLTGDTIVASGSIPTIATTPTGRWDAVAGYPAVTVQTELDELRDGELAERSRSTGGWSVRLRPGLWEPSLLGVGDTVRFAAVSGRLDVDDTFRVYQLDVSVDPSSGSETVVAHLDRRPPDLIRGLLEDRHRIAELERTR